MFLKLFKILYLGLRTRNHKIILLANTISNKTIIARKLKSL